MPVQATTADEESPSGCSSTTRSAAGHSLGYPLTGWLFMPSHQLRLQEMKDVKGQFATEQEAADAAKAACEAAFGPGQTRSLAAAMAAEGLQVGLSAQILAVSKVQHADMHLHTSVVGALRAACLKFEPLTCTAGTLG